MRSSSPPGRHERRDDGVDQPPVRGRVAASARSGSRSSAATGRGASGRPARPAARRAPPGRWRGRRSAAGAARPRPGRGRSRRRRPSRRRDRVPGVRRLGPHDAPAAGPARRPAPGGRSARRGRRSSAEPLGRRPGPGAADDHAHGGGRSQPSAAARETSASRVVRPAAGSAIGRADDGVDDQRLQPGVPGAAGLGRAGVGGGGGERDPAPEPQHALDQRRGARPRRRRAGGRRSSNTSVAIRTSSTVWRSVRRRARSRGAMRNASAVSRIVSAGSEPQATKLATPRWVTSSTPARWSAVSRRTTAGGPSPPGSAEARRSPAASSKAAQRGRSATTPAPAECRFTAPSGTFGDARHRRVAIRPRCGRCAVGSAVARVVSRAA